MLAPIWAPNTGMNPLAVLSTAARTVRSPEPDLGAGADPPLHASGQSVPRAGLSAMGKDLKNPRTRLQVDPVEEESSRGCSGIGRPPGASLIGVKSKRGGCGSLNCWGPSASEGPQKRN
jgi:hypothetical protein